MAGEPGLLNYLFSEFGTVAAAAMEEDGGVCMC